MEFILKCFGLFFGDLDRDTWRGGNLVHSTCNKCKMFTNTSCFCRLLVCKLT